MYIFMYILKCGHRRKHTGDFRVTLMLMPDITEMLKVNILQSWTITRWRAMSTHCTLSNPTGPCLFSPFHLSYVCAFRPLVATCPIRMQQRKNRNDLDNLRAPFYRHVPIQHPAETSLDTLVHLEETALLSTLDHFLTLRAGVCPLLGPIFDLWPSAFIGHTELMKWWGDTMSFKAGDETRRNSPIHVALEIH